MRIIRIFVSKYLESEKKMKRFSLAFVLMSAWALCAHTTAPDIDYTEKINAEGEVRISGYEVLLVNHYFENDKPVETLEGKRKRQIREDEEKQLKLF